MISNKQIAVNYAEGVLSEKIVACKYVKQACQRFLDDLNNPIYIYNENEVDRIILFISKLYLTEQTTPKNFILEDWQTFIICNIYGLYTLTGKRKIKNSYIELSRKQGKSQLITALALYHLLFDIDSQVVLSANSREQIKLIDYKKIKQFALQLDPKQKHIKLLYNKATFNTNELITTASDSTRLDGLNASFVLIDEMHEAKDNKVYNVLKSSQGARENPLFIVITTAGFNTDSFCYQLRSYCTSILNKDKIDESQFVIIYTLDENDNFEDPEVWKKANPNLNISLNSDFLESEVNKAKNNNIEKSGVLVKNFNIWQQFKNIDKWIDEKIITDSFQKISLTDPLFKDYSCFVGVDLAAVSDCTAVSYLIQLDEKFYFFNDIYQNEYAFENSVNSDLYKLAYDQGMLKLTSGNVTDYDIILNDILEVNKIHNINILAYDQWNSISFATNATNAGLNLTPFSQTAGSLNQPLKEFERLIKSDRIVIQENILIKWMFNNTIIKTDQKGNYSIDKSSRQKKVDGVAGIINAFGVYLKNGYYANLGNVY